MRRNRVFMQDPLHGQVGQMLEGISWVGTGVDYSLLTAAVAYGTESGVNLLVEELQTHPAWTSASKRWLLSLDFGHTEPRALEALAGLGRSEVRLANGIFVVQQPRFRPKITFHPKFYVFDGVNSPLRTSNFGVFVGSANLSRTGLKTGSEAATGEQWISPIRKEDLHRLQQTRRQLSWLEDRWRSADPLRTLLAEYKRRRRRRPQEEWRPPEEETEANSLYDSNVATEVSGDESVLLRTAKALWVETHVLYHNLGPKRPGNQLDLRPGTRVFFGFPPTAVPRNTILGPVTMTQSRSRSSVTKNLRFGNNMMDKLNLPVPGTEGPARGYDNYFLLFERDPTSRPERFNLERLTLAQLNRRRLASFGERRYRMAGGREFGLLF